MLQDYQEILPWILCIFRLFHFQGFYYSISLSRIFLLIFILIYLHYIFYNFLQLIKHIITFKNIIVCL